MPSFRAGVAIQRSRSGVPPEAVLDAARTAVATLCPVEDAFVDVAALARTGLPRVTIRFVVESSNDLTEDAEAWQVGKALAAAVGHVADWKDLRVFRRITGRWVLLEDHG
ncbi:MAG TPA: hypothetical protein PKD84_10770 [Propionicimonas sp.]|jgi:hypothetical protein|nr:hypothetical protein [Propionicimonas sp.]